LVKNTKAKVRRTLQNFGVDLSDEVEIKGLEDIKTRKEFNEFKQNLESFTNRNNLKFQFVKNEFGVVATKSELNEITRNRNKEIRVAKEKLKQEKKDPIRKQELLKMADPSRAGIHIPKPFNFKEVKSRTRLEDIAETSKRRSDPEFYNKRSEKMKDTFIRELEEAFNSDANYLVEQLKTMNPDEFLDLYKKYPSFDFQIFYILKYVDDFEQNKYLLEMVRDFKRYERENHDLKDF
jgi:transcription-repair coupling factor (superfamily II helicase)